ncbi:hypothetical protein Tco_0941529 [Tanacetum coccineum]|uniref:Uncharacterized protein n=1 Tax=Tanacetum coccineum TaxID=301880 RepID=A0ABQ5DXT6_9ASTR
MLIRKIGGPTQSTSISSDFISKLLNLDNPSPADNEIASLMDTTTHHATVTLKITSSFTTTISLPPLFFNPLSQQATPTASKTTTSLPALPDFAYYAKALSSIPAIVDRYIDNKHGEAINKAIQAHNFDCREEAQAEKREYTEHADLIVRTIIKEEVNTQLPHILPQAISDSLYEAAATLFDFELIKILIDKIEKNKSFDIDDYKRELYDALVKSYNTDKDIFESYGEVFSLKRSQVERDKDRDPSTGSNRGSKRRKSSKDVESSRDSRSKEKKCSSTSKDASQSQHKFFGKSDHAEEPSHAVEDSGMQQDQEFITRNNDEQPANKEVTKADCQVKHAEEPPTSFDELNDTSFDFSEFVMYRLKIPNLTQEILVGPAFNLLKGTCKSITELEYHFEECSNATTEHLNWHNPEKTNYLEYLKGGELSRRYSTSMTKTKAATYELKWIKDLVPELWSPVQLKYDQHAYLGTSHWGPKRQSFYRYASNMTSSKDVYSRRKIIAVTRLKIMKKYDYGHLEEIEVHQDDQKLYTFKEGDFKRLRLQDIEDMLLLLVQQKLTNLTIDERYDLNVALRMYTRLIVIQRSNLRNKTAYTSYLDPHGIIYIDQYMRKRLMHVDELYKFSDGMLNDVRSALHDIAAGIRIEYLPMRKKSNLDKKRAQVMVQDIDKQLYQRRLMRNLEKFVGGREYGNDLRLLERTI